MDLPCKFSRVIIPAVFLLHILALAPTALAGTAYTWLGLGNSNDWQDTTGNWDEINYPNYLAMDDTAIFSHNPQRHMVNNSASTTVSTMTFQDAYTFTNTGNFILSSSANNSGIVICKDLINCVGASDTTINNRQSLYFYSSTSSGGATLINDLNAQEINFSGTSNASDSKLTNNALVSFQGSASSASAAITNSGHLAFDDNSTANQANVINQGIIDFNNASSAGSASISNLSNQTINFNHTSTANQAIITNNGNTHFNTSANAGTATIGNNQTLDFNNSASAKQAHITNLGTLSFNNTASADQANISNAVNNILSFNATSNAAQAMITNQGNMSFNASANAGTSTLINSQTLTFNNSATANQAIITNTGTLYFNNFSTANSAVIDNSGGSIDLSGMDSATPLTLSALTDDSHSQIKLGSKQLILSTPTGNSILYGAIEDDHSGNSTFIKSGTGTLFLEGANTYSGSTNVLSGTLAVDRTSSLGTGPITVGSGATLKFVNSLFSSALGTRVYRNSLGCTPTIVSGAGSLVGSGTVGSLINNGNVAPGDPQTIGTLTVNCDFTANIGSTYDVKVDSQGNSDLLNVGGTAYLGGTVHILPLNNSYQTNTPYTILTANRIENTFDTFIQPIALDGELNYNYAEGKVTYQFYSLSNELADAVTTPNQIRVANYLLAITVPPPVYSELTGLITNQKLEAYLDQLSGATYADQQLALAQAGSLFDSQMRDRIQERQATDPLQPWLMARTSTSKLFSREVGGFKDTPDTLAYGVEEADQYGLFGLSLAYTDFHGKSVDSHELSTANADFYQIGGYGNHVLGDWLLAASASAGYLDNMDADRWVETGGGSSLDKIHARYHASLLSAQLQTSYAKMQLDKNIHLQPLLGVHYQHLDRGGFAEQGSTGAELIVNSSQFNSLRSQFGFAVNTRVNDRLQPFVQGVWEHEFADTVSSFDAGFQGSGGSFHIDGVKISRETYIGKAGLGLIPQPNWNLSAAYEGRFAKNLHENAAKLQVLYKFL